MNVFIDLAVGKVVEHFYWFIKCANIFFAFYIPFRSVPFAIWQMIRRMHITHTPCSPPATFHSNNSDYQPQMQFHLWSKAKLNFLSISRQARQEFSKNSKTYSSFTSIKYSKPPSAMCRLPLKILVFSFVFVNVLAGVLYLLWVGGSRLAPREMCFPKTRILAWWPINPRGIF